MRVKLIISVKQIHFLSVFALDLFLKYECEYVLWEFESANIEVAEYVESSLALNGVFTLADSLQRGGTSLFYTLQSNCDVTTQLSIYFPQTRIITFGS